MMELKGVAKNPLAIIALFISFMYGSASLILGTSIDKLDGFNKNALVLFLILFPVLIFAAFLYLVVKHHTKLYAPGDYRSDESFLAGLETVKRSKPVEETDEEAPPPAEEEAPAVEGQPAPLTEVSASIAGRSAARQNARLAQSLVADLFQKRFGGLLKRDVRFVAKNGRTSVFDFAIEVRDTVYCGEVKYTRDGALASIVHTFHEKFSILDDNRVSDSVRFVKLGVIVYEDRAEFAIASAQHLYILERLRDLKNTSVAPDFMLEGFTMSELLRGDEAIAAE